MDAISALLSSVFVVMILIAGFGMMSGANTSSLISTYVNLIFRVLLVIGETLTKIAIPLLSHIGEKIVYTARHHIAQNKAKMQQSALPNNQDSPPGQSSNQNPTPQESKPAKPSSANPYDDPPQPEIMD